ncbi:hypothetical protein ACVWWO_007379 [Bradyrhizobium sp. F1.13.1]
MCDSNVGVVRRIEVESISEDMAEFLKKLDSETSKSALTR